METTKQILINSFQQACKARGYDPKKALPDVSAVPPKHQAAITAFAKLLIISEAQNEGREFNWNDYDEQKWHPWFDVQQSDANPSGFRFLGATMLRTVTEDVCGARICFRTQAEAVHIATTFLNLFKDLLSSGE